MRNPLTLVFVVWPFVTCGKPWALLNGLSVSIRGTASDIPVDWASSQTKGSTYLSMCSSELHHLLNNVSVDGLQG